MSVEEKERKNEPTACRCADANECQKKKKKKKTYLEWGHADVNALRADANECKKKRRKKKKLTWNGGMQTRMHCVRMVLHADGVACR